MFHRFVDHNGKQIDYDRAAWLMDHTVFSQALNSLNAALGLTSFDAEISHRMRSKVTIPTDAEILQTLWDNYCAFHENKYGSPFNPDVM